MDAINIQAVLPGSAEIKSGAVEEKLKRNEGRGFSATLDRALGREEKSPHTKGPRQLDRKLWDVCVEAESLFVSKMLKEMRKTVPKGDFLHGGFAEEIFEDMLYDEYSLQMSRNANLGLAKMMYEELSRRV